MTNNKITELLAKYVEGKDLDRHKILEEIYCQTATVSFEIIADNINFPREIYGNIEIAKILSSEFNKKYDFIRTYYLSSHFPDIDSLLISQQNWLVIMRDKTSGNIRVGTGYYNWEFESKKKTEYKIKHHKIFIYTMLELPSESLGLLHDLQRKFTYPWIEKEIVVQSLEPFDDFKIITNYLKQMCSRA